MRTVTVIESNDANLVEESKYVTRDEIGAQYKWSDSMARRYLGKPDRVEERYSSTHGRYTIHLFLRARVLSAQTAPGFRPRRPEPEPIEVPLLDAVREASRCAHRWRDRANDRWNAGKKKSASTASSNKKNWYGLKDAGIVAMHRAGDLRYVGASPQGMAVYECGEGGMSCFHSTLHPAGAERTVVQNHPETLFVPAKKQKLRLVDVEQVLGTLPHDTTGYERSLAPRIARELRTLICYACGEEGHIVRECPNDGDYADDDGYNYQPAAKRNGEF
jgi:hypothetical protein